MIVAKICGQNIEEEVVTANSDLDKKLVKASLGTYPILEISQDSHLCGSVPIAAHIARSSGKQSLLGASPFAQAEVTQWLDFLSTKTQPLVSALQWFTFGHAQCSTVEYNHVYELYKENMKQLNKHLTGKSFFVGSEMTLVDVYFTLGQVEMQQAIMDTNFRNSLNCCNAVFKQVADTEAFKARMGAIKQGKKQLMPQFSDKK